MCDVSLLHIVLRSFDAVGCESDVILPVCRGLLADWLAKVLGRGFNITFFLILGTIHCHLILPLIQFWESTTHGIVNQSTAKDGGQDAGHHDLERQELWANISGGVNFYFTDSGFATQTFDWSIILMT